MLKTSTMPRNARNYSSRFLSKFQKCLVFFLFARWVPIGTPGLRPAGPLSYTSHLNSQGLFRSPAPYRGPRSRSLTSFICSGSIPAKPKICILTFSNTGHSHKMCIDFPFSALHLLHESLCSPLLVQHVLQIHMPIWEPYQHSAMFPVQFFYKLNIPIS